MPRTRRAGRKYQLAKLKRNYKNELSSNYYPTVTEHDGQRPEIAKVELLPDKVTTVEPVYKLHPITLNTDFTPISGIYSSDPRYWVYYGQFLNKST